MTEQTEFYAGIDYSMSCPSITVYNVNKNNFKFSNVFVFYMIKVQKYVAKFGKNVQGFSLKEFEKLEPLDRYLAIADWAGQILESLNVKKVALEGYSYGSSKGVIFNIAENTTCLKIQMNRLGIEYYVPAPKELKKFYTGNGNASKEVMVTKFIEEEGVFLHELMDTSAMWSKPIEDIVDSYAACKWLLNKEGKL